MHNIVTKKTQQAVAPAPIATAVTINPKAKPAKKASKAASKTSALVEPKPANGRAIQEPETTPVVAPTLIAEQEEPKIVRIRRYVESQYEFRYDIVLNDVEWRSRAPDTNGHPDTFTTINESTLTLELFERGFTGFKDMLNALLRSSWVPQYDPIQAYFEGLPAWTPDKPDYIGQLASYVSAADQTWFLNQYRKMLVRTVACGLGVIPFNKHCMVFVGRQHDGKSSFVRFHCPPTLENYYTEQIDFEGKDGQIALAGNFIVNLDELANFNKADINKAKAFLTTDKIKVRHPFDPKPKVTKRRASFFGSTNETAFLTDATGNVRWLVIKENGVRHDNGGEKGYARNVDINNVWAQAYALLNSGFRHEMTKDEIEQSEQNNREHLHLTTEMELVQRHLQTAEPKAVEAEFVMANEIVQWLEKRYDYRVKLNKVAMGKALSILGFPIISGRRFDCTNPIRAYWIKFFQ